MARAITALTKPSPQVNSMTSDTIPSTITVVAFDDVATGGPP